MDPATIAPSNQEVRIQLRTGARIRELRQARGMRSRDLAALARISQGQLSKIENGKAAISIKNLGRLCRILDRPVSYLFQTDAEMPKVLGTVTTVKGPENKAIQWFAAEVERLSANRISLLPLTAAQLGSADDQIELLSRGVIDLFIDDLAVYQKFDPAFQVFEFPYTFRSVSHQQAFLEGLFFSNRMRPALKKHGICFLNPRWNWVRGLEWVLIASRPIRHPGDIRDLRVRITESGSLARFWRLLGAQPVAVPWAGIKKALRDGRIDVVPTHKSHLYPLGFCRYARYVTLLGDVPPVLGIGVNRIKYQALVPAIQDVLRSASIAAGDYFTTLVRQTEKANEHMNIRRYRAVYLNIDPHPWRQATQAVLERLLSRQALPREAWNELG